MSPALSPTTQGRHKLSGAGSLPETVLDASSRSEKSQGSSSARSPKAYRDADDNKHHKWSGASPLSLASLNLALARFLTALRSSHQARIRLAALCSLVLLGVALLLLPRTHNGSNNRYGSHSRIVNPNLSSSRDDGVNIVSSHKHHRDIYIAPEILEKRKQIASDKKYRKKYRDPLWDGDCEPMQWWQETLFPVCNSIHEIDRRGDFAMASFRHIATGGYNDVFTFLDSMQRRYVMKTLKGPELTDFTDRNFDRARRDALIMERLTRSPYIMNIYGFCGFTLLGDYAPEKSMDHYLWRPRELLPLPEQLQLACQAARALADAHDIDGDGRAAITHGDFASKQYIRVNGVYRLNDFNRGRFLRWNPKKQETCTYTIGNNDGTFRSPEEYKYDPENAAIDVWSLGTIFFEILTGHHAWDKFGEKEAQQLIIDGKLPPIEDEILNSTEPIRKVLIKAIEMCYVYSPDERPKAGEVAEYLANEAKRFGVNWEARHVS